jgi:hypothetical protein
MVITGRGKRCIMPCCRWPERVISLYEDKRYHFRPELSVDAHAIIAMLRAERRELGRAIDALEQLEQLEQRYEMPKSGRGRKSMGNERAKGRLGTHDALLAGLAHATSTQGRRCVLIGHPGREGDAAQCWR